MVSPLGNKQGHAAGVARESARHAGSDMKESELQLNRNSTQPQLINATFANRESPQRQTE